MSRRLFSLTTLSVLVAFLSLTELSYGAAGINSSEVNLPAGIQYARADNPGLFDDQRSVVGYQPQTKEWEARTLRTLGLGELAFGLGTATVGLMVIGDDFVGIIPLIVGIGVAYLGYTDLSASKRFFYPDPLFSGDRLKEERLSRTEFDRQGPTDLAFAMQLKF